MHVQAECGIRPYRLPVAGLAGEPVGNRRSECDPLGGVMEVAELKSAINDLEARMAKIRDWL